MNKINIFSRFIFISLAALLLQCQPAAAFAEGRWAIDSDMKFNFGYLPSEKSPAASADTEIEKTADMGLSNPYLPDITNIKLDGFIGLGFPMPSVSESEKYNVFIKLFNFPESFKAEKSSLPIIEGYLLGGLRNGQELRDYAFDAKNLAVKLCLIEKSDAAFSETNPYPSLKINKNAQKEFVKNTIFSSLYITPGAAAKESANDDELAKYSANGVLAFHKEAVKMYKNQLIDLRCINDDKHYYFGLKMANGRHQMLRIIKVPKQPMVFANWRELPMPHDPAKIFLSGLLLLYKYDYVLKNGQNNIDSIPAVGSPQFEAQYEKINAHVLEIASVIKLKK